MTVENLQKAEPRAISGSPVRLRGHKEHRAFRDNLEHLEALEYVARLKLAIAYLRSGKASEHSAEEDQRVLISPPEGWVSKNLNRRLRGPKKKSN